MELDGLPVTVTIRLPETARLKPLKGTMIAGGMAITCNIAPYDHMRTRKSRPRTTSRSRLHRFGMSCSGPVRRSEENSDLALLCLARASMPEPMSRSGTGTVAAVAEPTGRQQDHSHDPFDGHYRNANPLEWTLVQVVKSPTFTLVTPCYNSVGFLEKPSCRRDYDLPSNSGVSAAAPTLSGSGIEPPSRAVTTSASSDFIGMSKTI